MKKKVVKKSTTKKPATKKSTTKPKRKAGSSELVTIVERLAAITEQLAVTAERLAQAPPAQVATEQVVVEPVGPEEDPNIAARRMGLAPYSRACE